MRLSTSQYMCKIISNDDSVVHEEINEEVVHKKQVNEEDVQFSDALEAYNNNDFSQAKDILNNILSINKNHVDSLTLMAQILYEQYQIDISKMFLKRALAIDKANGKANELEVLLNTNQSINHEVNVEINTLDDEDVLYDEAYDLYEQGDLETAFEILEKLIDFDGKNADALALMGLIYYHSGIFPKAVEYFKKAYKIDKNGEMVRELKMRVS